MTKPEIKIEVDKKRVEVEKVKITLLALYAEMKALIKLYQETP